MSLLDWLVLGAYSLLLVVTGWWFNRRSTNDTNDYFLGGRQMPVWAVAVSVVATSLSAATFVGGPQQAYANNLTYLSSNIGMILAAVVVAWLVIPKLYATDVATPYGLLEKRFGPRARRSAAIAFLLGRVMASGSRIYIIGIPAALILFGDASGGSVAIPASQIVIAVGLMAAVGVVYTLVGGVRSVIWTDVVQMVVFVVAVAGAILLLLARIPGGAPAAYEALKHASAPDGTAKLTLIDTSINFTSNYTLLASCTAFVLMGIASFGLDQDMTQRMLTCSSAPRGAASVIIATIGGVPVVAMFMAVGLLLYVFYQRPEIMGDETPGYLVDDSRQVFLWFILRELPAGLRGLMFAGLFAAGLSSLNSALNSMSSTVVNDFYKEIRPNRSERHYLLIGRIGVVVWGVILGGFAVVCIYWQRSGEQTLIDFALGVMTFAYSGLLGVFATALLTRRGSSNSTVAALVVGAAMIFMLNPSAMGLLIDTQAVRDAALPTDAQAGSRFAQLVSSAWSLGFAWKLALGAGLATLVCASVPGTSDVAKNT